MSQRRPRAGRLDPARVGTAGTRVGLAVVAVAMPLVVGTAAGFVTETGSLGAAYGRAAAAMAAPVVGAPGTTGLFHLAALALLVGCWLLGAGLVLDGAFD